MATKVTPLQRELADRIAAHRREISEWYLERVRQALPPFYCSVDLRDSGAKIAPVDSNLYPAGFNNLCPEDIRTAPPILRSMVESLAASLSRETPRRVLILPEAHTQNRFYAENLAFLDSIVKEAGFETRVGWYAPNPPEGPVRLVTPSGTELLAHPIRLAEDGTMEAQGFVPDLVLLNNDFSGGYPEGLARCAQPIVPSLELGWHTRKKSDHFDRYNALAEEFANLIGADPWRIQVDTVAVGPVSFNDEVGTEEVARQTGLMLERVASAYRERGVKQEPFVFVKNNAGTYGMGIMVARSADEIRQMNRRTKNKMSVGKGRSRIESVVVQEGIPTATLVDRLPAEPVIYLVGHELIGGFLRTNTERGTEENLNAEGMVFRKLCMSDLRLPEESDGPTGKLPVLELVYGSIARLSALATGMEIAAHRERRGSRK